MGRDNFFLEDADDTSDEVITAFIKQYYNEATFVPHRNRGAIFAGSDRAAAD